jgi:hypothetical protein
MQRSRVAQRARHHPRRTRRDRSPTHGGVRVGERERGKKYTKAANRKRLAAPKGCTEVSEKEIAEFKEKAASLKKRDPKALKTKTGKAYIAQREWDDDTATGGIGRSLHDSHAEYGISAWSLSAAAGAAVRQGAASVWHATVFVS